MAAGPLAPTGLGRAPPRTFSTGPAPVGRSDPVAIVAR
jgi:hypothetical protein